MNRTIGKITILALGIIALACGDVRSPLENTNDQAPLAAIDQNAPPAGIIAFGPRSLARARAKVAAHATTWSGLHYVAVDADLIDASEGGSLEADFPDYGPDGIVRATSTEFEVEANSIGGADPVWEDSHLILMKSHSGERLDEILVEFYPSGMTFSPVAKLTVKGVGPINVDDLVAYHIEGDGSVSQPPFTVKVTDDGWKIKVDVPGFSEYTYDDDDSAPDTMGVQVEKVLPTSALAK